ncbi:MAG: type I-E CRISPR-associated protein Cse1/CasA [Thermodesulfobacteriota bacterium]
MNLIEDAWIPARRQSGAVERIAPWQLTDRFAEDPFVGLAAPRPDFNGALAQFLVGLLQTCFAPEDGREWRSRRREPPDPPTLKKAFAPVSFAFDLDGDGPRFLQDLTLGLEIEALAPVDRAKRLVNIEDMLIEVPSGGHFVKRGRVGRLCPACAASALLTLQVNASSGGRGHRAGMRGPRFLTTLVQGDSLWATCWLNTLESRAFLSWTGNPEKGSPEDRFPWLQRTRTSEKDQKTTPDDAHPAQAFWAMPRRIRLLFSASRNADTCDLCGLEGLQFVQTYLTKNHGVNYDGPWRHPLSPHYVNEDGSVKPIRSDPGGIGYRHWLGLVQSVTDGKGGREPAAVVTRYLRAGSEDLRLWAFGYDMDNMKARCWHDSTMPLFACPEDIREDFAFRAASLVRGADVAAFETRSHVRKALFKPGSDVKGDLSFVSGRLWQETEPAFFGALPRIREVLQTGGDVVPEVEAWHRLLVRTAERIFDDLSQTGAFEAADPKRIALAWRDLQKVLRGKKLRETLGLPLKAAAKAAPKKRKEG